MSVMDLPVTTAAPTRSIEQRRAALRSANRIRTHRAELKKQLKAGQRHVVQVLLEPEVDVETMKVLDLLLAVPKVGRVKAQKVLVRARISPSKTIGGLSQRQRGELVQLLAPYSSRGRATMRSR